MYSITARRMISGLVLKYLNEAGLVMGKSYATTLPRSSKGSSDNTPQRVLQCGAMKLGHYIR